MAIKARIPGQTFHHVLRADVRPARIEATEANPEPDNSAHDEWKPTKWVMRVLDSKVLGLLKDRVTSVKVNPAAPDEDVTTEVNQSAYYYEVCKFGLLEPENYDGKFSTTKLNRGGVSYVVAADEFVNTIGLDNIEELADRIIAGNGVTIAEGNA